MQKLSVIQIQSKLESFPGWEYIEEDQRLVSGFEFESFDQAVQFINELADLANEINHHPDILLHEQKFVSVFTSTHSAKGITDKDFELVTAIEQHLENSL